MGESSSVYYGGFVGVTRRLLRAGLNRLYSQSIKRSLRAHGRSINLDFTTRIYGAGRVSIGSHFHSGRGFKVFIERTSDRDVFVDIGDRVAANEYVTLSIGASLRIGNDVLIGSRVYIGNVSHGFYRGRHPESAPDVPPLKRPMCPTGITTIEDGVWIGEGVLIPSGITIGRGSVVGAGSVVTKSLPAGVVAAGNPARIIKQYQKSTESWMSVSLGGGNA